MTFCPASIIFHDISGTGVIFVIVKFFVCVALAAAVAVKIKSLTPEKED